jgi:diguanylate cyclase (GGDEF)-like protein
MPQPKAVDEGNVVPVKVTAEDEKLAHGEVRRSARGIVPGAMAFEAAAMLLSSYLISTNWPHLTGMRFALAVTALTVAMQVAPVLILVRIALRRGAENLAQTHAREREMVAEAHRREFETRLGNALEMAANEWEVLSVAGRAVTSLVGDDRVEILLADNSNAHLERALVSGSDPDGPACGVTSPSQCVAARRGQTQVFNDSDALDACPHLQGREYGRCAGVCVPVSIMGRTTGVVHWAGAVTERPPRSVIDQLEVLANQSGARIGMIRVVSESQLQATTDHLTGLLNRRAFEAKVRDLTHTETPYSLVMADLDHFKDLNDTHGHDAGDRALRVFVSVLRSVLRPGDLACRYGGEEFVLALPNCDGDAAVRVCERLREALALAGLDGTVPVFTCSFGVAPPRMGATLQDMVSEADAALYEAKDAGRNRSVMLDAVKRAELETRISLAAGRFEEPSI